MDELTFADILEYLIIKAQKKGNITNKVRFGKSAYKEVSNDLNQLDEVHNGIKEFYNREKDGYGIEWEKDKNKGIGGKIKLATIKEMFSDQSRFIDNEMIRQDEDIQFFQPFDFSTPEAQCGFIIRPKGVEKSIYYNQAGYGELHDLDLDFNGYTQMACEARVFNNWQIVLLHHLGWDYGAKETSYLKEQLPVIFQDWTWEGFIEKYESLRLSNKDK